jgi:hypothetical protein
MGHGSLYTMLDIRMYQSTIPCDLLIDSLLQGQPSELKRLQLHRETPRTEVKLHVSSDRESVS